MCLHLEPANLLRPCLRQPGQDRAGRVALDDLFGCPQAVGGSHSLYPDHLVGRQSQLAEPTDVRLLRRRNQVQTTALAGESRNGWAEQSPFADCGLCREELSQTSSGPTPSGELCIQRSKAGRNGD